MSELELPDVEMSSSVRSNRSDSTGTNNYNDFFQRGPYNHQDENCIRSSDGIMILEDGLSIGFGDKDIWDPTQISYIFKLPE